MTLRRAAAFALAAALLLAGCAAAPSAPTNTPPATPPVTGHPHAQDLPDLEGYQTGAAVGLLTRPSLWRWLGRLVMTAVQNTTVRIDLGKDPAPAATSTQQH